MYTGEDGYLTDKSIKNKLFEAVDACIELGLYVIIDWHILEDKNPMSNVTEAEKFFDEVSKKYGKYPNVLYEIMNEPNGKSVTWSGQCKPYAQRIINVIRANDPDNIILVGNPSYSSLPQEVIDSPLTGDYAKNICYTFHLYTNELSDKYLNRIESARKKGMCVFVSEWGAMDNDGDGDLNTTNGNKFINKLEGWGISWVCWALGDKDETCCLLWPEEDDGSWRASLTGGWPLDDVSDWGKYVRSKIRLYN